MGLIERAERSFCLEKCMILVSVDGFFQFLPKLVEEKVSSRTEKTGKNHGKNHPLEETANPANIGLGHFNTTCASMHNLFIYGSPHLKDYGHSL